jgi:hypothetical protein
MCMNQLRIKIRIHRLTFIRNRRVDGTDHVVVDKRRLSNIFDVRFFFFFEELTVILDGKVKGKTVGK